MRVARGEPVQLPMLPGDVARPGGRGNVIPMRPSTTKLVPQLIDGRDPYAELLDKIPEIQPGQFGSHFMPGLVPDENEISGLAEMNARVQPVNTTVSDEIELEDAGGAGRQSRRNKDLPGAGGDAA